MNLIVNQTIMIQQLKVGGITNSSILQIGCAGIIKSRSNLYNTGQFTGPAPETAQQGSGPGTPFVPLPNPT
ncbi:spore germination protein GerPB [Paenibacillus koleovorans]|uniref:spore germination protein GerPB n=1 Tax=Paenibacillus koleovorans TaxID=121608 RepID=UPI000FD9FC2C|nr:spore germination protein GerPB [Paenibacillus koleovorans]